MFSLCKAFRRLSAIEHTLYARFVQKKNLNSVICLLQRSIRERVSLSKLSSKQVSRGSNNSLKLFNTFGKAFAFTLQRVVPSFAKDLFCSKASSLSNSKLPFIGPKICSLFGENFKKNLISTIRQSV